MSNCPFSDLAHPDTFQGGVPHDMFRELRHSEPISWHDDPATGVGYWAVTRLEELDYISKHPLLFSSRERTCFPNEPDEDLLPLLQMQLINMDPPDHLKYRRIARAAFTPSAVDAYKERFQGICKDIIDNIIDKGTCEFVTEIAAELPLIAICELMSIPLDQRDRLFELTNIMLGADDPELTTTSEDGHIAMMEMFEMGRQVAIRHRENPKPCIVGSLLDGTVEGEHLTEDEFCNFFMLLIFAGNETTRTVTSHGMRLLMEHPDQYQMLVEDPTLIPHAIEEMLRISPAVIQFRRTATEDLELQGKQIKKGDKIMMFYHSANRDESVFTDPEIFDIKRPLREDVRHGHRAFGVGEHFCLGSHLARLELQTIFEEIVSRIRNPKMIGETNWLRSNFVHGIKHMNISYDPA